MTLLRHDAGDSFLAAPPDLTPLPDLGRPSSEPEHIGPYLILRKLGEGGMGTVYLARQTTPVNRDVAVKRVRPGMASNEVLARFEIERQSLARMTHSSIARVYDAGIDEDGCPYFAMEHVDGEPITQYCDRENLSIEARIELYLSLCDAIGHAHQNGVIHRDIKPSNVLVADESGRPVPKVIDFGIARAIRHEPTDPTRLTRQGSLIGTPQYMSPEQAIRSSDIDTRSDLYSLGALLYECLTGVSPLGTDLPNLDECEVRRRIREDDPMPLSRCLSSLGAPSNRVARKRGLSVTHLTRRLRGDLEWITAKAMDKDRERRYASASELRADLERYLHQEPVEAGPPSRLYRLRKFTRRNGVAVAAALLVILALAVGATGTTIGLWHGLDQARAAEELARSSEQRARSDADSAEAIVDFLLTLFRSAGPSERPIGSVTAAEILDKATARIDTDFAADPRARARLTAAMAGVQGRLARIDIAIELALKAVDLGMTLDDTSPTLLIDARRILAQQYVRQERLSEAREQLDFAESLLDETLSGGAPSVEARRWGETEATHRARLWHIRAQIARQSGAFDDASRLLRRVLEITANLGDRANRLRASTLASLGQVAILAGRFADAERDYRAAVTLYEQSLPSGHPDIGEALAGLGNALSRRHETDEAEVVLRRSLEILERSVGSKHMALAPTLATLGQLLVRTRRLDKAEPILRRTASIVESVLGHRHPERLKPLGMLANLERARGNLDDALTLYRDALEIAVLHKGEDDVDTLGIRLNRSMTLAQANRSVDALTEFERLSPHARRVLGARHPIAVGSTINLCMLLARAGRHEEATATTSGLIDELRITRPDTRYDIPLACALSQRAQLHLQSGGRASARSDAIEARDLALALERPGDPRRAIALQNAALVLRWVGEESSAPEPVLSLSD